MSRNMKPCSLPGVSTGIQVNVYASIVPVAKTMSGCPKKIPKHRLINPGSKRLIQTRQTQHIARTTMWSTTCKCWLHPTPPAYAKLSCLMTLSNSSAWMVNQVSLIVPSSISSLAGSVASITTAIEAAQSLFLCWLRIQRSEEHTSELQSHSDFVCRLLPDPKIAVEAVSNARRMAQHILDRD